MLSWFCLKDPVHWVDFPHSLCRLLSSWLWSFLSDSLGCAIWPDDYIGPGSKQLIDIAYVEDILGKGIVWTSGGSAAPLELLPEKQRNRWWRVGELLLLFSKRFGEFSTVLYSRKFVYRSFRSPNIKGYFCFLFRGTSANAASLFFCSRLAVLHHFVPVSICWSSRGLIVHLAQMKRKHVRPRKASLFWITHRFWCLINMNRKHPPIECSTPVKCAVDHHSKGIRYPLVGVLLSCN